MSKKDNNTPIVKKDLYDLSDAMLNGVQIMFDNQDKKYDKKFTELESNLRSEIKRVESHLSDEIDGLKADLSTTVSKKEFNQFKSKVDSYIVTS